MSGRKKSHQPSQGRGRNFKAVRLKIKMETPQSFPQQENLLGAYLKV